MKNSPSRARIGLIAVMLALVPLLAMADRVDDAATSVSEPEAAAEDSVLAEAASVRQEGSAGGEELSEMLRESAEIRQMLDRSSDGLLVVHHADGRKSVRLDGRFMSVVVAQLSSGSGELVTACIDDLPSQPVEPPAEQREIK